MAKKYIAPTMKVIMVSNDIIATSGDAINNKMSSAAQLKGGMMDFDFEDEEF